MEAQPSSLHCTYTWDVRVWLSRCILVFTSPSTALTSSPFSQSLRLNAKPGAYTGPEFMQNKHSFSHGTQWVMHLAIIYVHTYKVCLADLPVLQAGRAFVPQILCEFPMTVWYPTSAVRWPSWFSAKTNGLVPKLGHDPMHLLSRMYPSQKHIAGSPYNQIGFDLIISLMSIWENAII